MSDGDTFDDYEAALARRTGPDADRGVVRLVVARKGNDRHEVLGAGTFTAADGLVGDRWTADQDPTAASQITLMQAAVVEAISDGELVPTSGDNLQVDLDLQVSALPIGARLRVGTALLEVTPEPHRGCRKFSVRFGTRALQWVNGKPREQRRLRGVHCRVVEDGVVRPGDVIQRTDDG